MDCLLLVAAFGDVSENQDDARYFSVRVANGSRAIVNRSFLPAFGDQERVIRKPYDQTLSQSFGGGVLNGFTRLLIYYFEDCIQRLAGSLVQRPTR